MTTAPELGLDVHLKLPAAEAIQGPPAGSAGILYGGPGRLVGWSAVVGTLEPTDATQVVSNPAAGADWTFTVPAGQTLALESVTALLTTSVTVANRVPTLVVKDNLGRIVAEVVSPNAQAASLADEWVWAPGVVAAAGPPIVTPIPPGLELAGGWTIGTVTAGLQVGDQWSAIVITGQLATTSATVQLFDGYDTTGRPMAIIGGQAGFTDSDTFAPSGIRIKQGLFVTGNAGVTLQAVYVILEGPDRHRP